MSNIEETQIEFIAFKGIKFTIEWYYGENKKSQSKDYFESLDENRKISTLNLFKLMGNIGQIRNKEKFNFEGDGIYAFKPQPDRFLCFFQKGQKIIVTNGFHKKQDKLPVSEKDRALKARASYFERLERGNYYESFEK